MNEREKWILSLLFERNVTTQRELAKCASISLGMANKIVKNMQSNNYINEKLEPTQKAIELFSAKRTKQAIILAAGYGMRMVPINSETPKGLLEVKGEKLIERIIRQLKEVNINDIVVVVGFMKEKYEYLIDKYRVKLIVNADYSTKNNLHSLKKTLNYIDNTYIIPCDIWCEENPFKQYEPYTWYTVSSKTSIDSNVKINRKNQLKIISNKENGNSMIGISYIDCEDAQVLKKNILDLVDNSKYDMDFWESALFKDETIMVYANIVDDSKVVEINTYEQLRNIDSNSSQLKSYAIKVICDALKIKENIITDITVLKKGMTNRSFLFTANGKKYIMRIPGEGTDQLINRAEESEVYKNIKNKNICDDVIYINPDNGYKITEFIENSRVCNCENQKDLKMCMKFLKKFHSQKINVSHEFDIFKQIEFYESLWNSKESVYSDYEETKVNVYKLKKFIDNLPREKVLTHIDAVPDNFLIFKKNGKDEIRLIDWEYSGMQDPHVDVAMFCIYSLYNKTQIDNLISIYFENKCEENIRMKIYAYIACCGLLWSNWCEYKRQLGIDFGEYSLCQYRYAKEYYRIVEDYIKGVKNA